MQSISFCRILPYERRSWYKGSKQLTIGKTWDMAYLSRVLPFLCRSSCTLTESLFHCNWDSLCEMQMQPCCLHSHLSSETISCFPSQVHHKCVCGYKHSQGCSGAVEWSQRLEVFYLSRTKWHSNVHVDGLIHLTNIVRHVLSAHHSDTIAFLSKSVDLIMYCLLFRRSQNLRELGDPSSNRLFSPWQALSQCLNSCFSLQEDTKTCRACKQ